MSEINDLIEDFIDQDKILTNGFFIDDTTKVLNDDYDPVQQLKNVGR